MRPYASVKALCCSNYTCFTGTWVLGYWGNLGKVGSNTPNHVQGRMKDNSKSSAPCFTSNVRALCGLSYTCFSDTQILRHFWESGPKYSKSRAGTHEKESKIFRSLCYIKWDLTLLSKPSVEWVIPVSQVLRFWGNLGKVGLNTPNHAQIHMNINPKSSASHQISFYSSV